MNTYSKDVLVVIEVANGDAEVLKSKETSNVAVKPLNDNVVVKVKELESAKWLVLSKMMVNVKSTSTVVVKSFVVVKSRTC